MKKLILNIIALSTLLISCSNDDKISGEGSIVTEEIAIADFKGIETYGDNNVIISKGAVQKVEVTGHSNIIDRLKRDVASGIWKMELEEGSYTNADLSFNITLPIINSVDLYGSGGVVINEHKSEENMDVRIYGSGNIELGENEGSTNLNLLIEGSGNIKAFESFSDLENIEVDIIGAGFYEGFPVISNNCDINIEGSGRAKIYTEDVLNVRIVGSGAVNYKGDPSITVDITGSGKLINEN